MPNLITPAQIRGARGLLDWSMLDLARAAAVSVSTVKRAERSAMPQISAGIDHVIRAALEEAGVRLLDDTGEGIGLRFAPWNHPPHVALAPP